MTWTKRETQEAQEQLRELLPPGSTVWTVLRHVSRSGMYRAIDVYALTCEGGEADRLWLSRLVAKACGDRFDERREAVGVSGCGMDMGFAIASDLAYRLYPDGFGCTGEGCPSNDHSNGDRDRTPHAEAKARACEACHGTGERKRGTFGTMPPEPCPFCDATGDRGEGHWHKSGSYALAHRWL